jgi:maltooligosyltrehalose trehalohydrolase
VRSSRRGALAPWPVTVHRLRDETTRRRWGLRFAFPRRPPDSLNPDMLDRQPWFLDRGARLLENNAVRFSIWAPHLERPRIRICHGAAEGEHALARVDNERGVFAATIPDVGVGTDYMIVTDDQRALPDPVSRWQPHGVHGASRVVDPNAFQWNDVFWRGLTMEELVVYELHVGTFTPEGTFAAIIPRLTELKSLGVTAIELMPVAQFPGERNWGYDGVHLYAVHDSYGGPDELKALIDAAHSAGLGVILDVVYNHVGPEGNYLDTFGPYFTDRYCTAWGRAVNYDDAGSDEVRRFVIDNALYWVTEFHVDGLRLDAVHSIFDFGARHLLEELASAVHDQAAFLDRPVVIIAESDLNDPKLLRQTIEHGYGLDGQWSDDFHHSVHALLTGERAGYYADFGTVAMLADSLREPFVFEGQYSEFRNRRHGASSAGLPRSRFIVSIQNHDQVGNRASGDRLSTLLRPDQRRLAAALLLLSPYVPMLFMGEEYGETNPFLYFVDHGDAGLVDAVRRGRVAEFASFKWTSAIPDPADLGTFDRSKLDWPTSDHGAHNERAQMLALYRDLLALRRDEPMLRPDGARITVDDGAGWITLLRETPFTYTRPGNYEGDMLVSVFNCSDREIDVPLPGAGDRAWSVRFSTDSPTYGGESRVASYVEAVEADDGPKRLLAEPKRQRVRMPAWSAALFASI